MHRSPASPCCQTLNLVPQRLFNLVLLGEWSGKQCGHRCSASMGIWRCCLRYHFGCYFLKAGWRTFTTSLIGGKVAFIERHRNTFAYSDFSDLTTQKKGLTIFRRPDNESAFPTVQKLHSPSCSAHASDSLVLVSSHRSHDHLIRSATQQSASC